jgi:ankyrin repeat protein
VKWKNFDPKTSLAQYQEIVTLLLARDDIEVNSEDVYGWTPLSFAAHTGWDEVVTLLLARDNIEVNSKDVCGWTPLSIAVQRGCEEVVNLLLM